MRLVVLLAISPEPMRPSLAKGGDSPETLLKKYRLSQKSMPLLKNMSKEIDF